MIHLLFRISMIDFESVRRLALLAWAILSDPVGSVLGDPDLLVFALSISIFIRHKGYSTMDST